MEKTTISISESEFKSSNHVPRIGLLHNKYYLKYNFDIWSDNIMNRIYVEIISSDSI